MGTDVLLLTALAVAVLVAAVWYCASAGRKGGPPSAPASAFLSGAAPPVSILAAFEAAGQQAMARHLDDAIGKHKAQQAMKGLAEVFTQLDRVLPDPK